MLVDWATFKLRVEFVFNCKLVLTKLRHHHILMVLMFFPAGFEDMIAVTPLHDLFFPKDGSVPELGTYGDENKAYGFRLALIHRDGGFYFDADIFFNRGKHHQAARRRAPALPLLKF